MKFDPLGRLQKAWYKLKNRAAASVRRFGKQTNEVFSEEPIDFSAPSIPYYENLANRMSFVRVILYMALFVFVVVTVVSNHRLITYENLYYLAKDIGAATLTAQSEADHLSYPISAADADFTIYRGGLAVAGSDVVTVLSDAGRKTLSVNVNYASPVLRASDKYLLSFGRGETSFSVYNSFVQVHKENTDFPVYDAAVADNGTFAIVTRSRDYTSEVLIYDGNMERIAAYHLGGYVTGLAINPSGTCLGVVSLASNVGVAESTLTMIRMENRISSETVTLSGTCGGTCGFISDSRFAVILSDRLLVLRSDATITREVFFEGREPLLGTVTDRQVALLSRDAEDLSVEYITSYNEEGDLLYEVIVDGDHPIRLAGGAETLVAADKVLYIRAGEMLYCLENGGRKLSAATISRDALAILHVRDDEVRVCTPAYATRLSSKDFSTVDIP